MAPLMISMTAQALPITIDYRVLLNSNGKDHEPLRSIPKPRVKLKERPCQPDRTPTRHALIGLATPIRSSGKTVVSSFSASGIDFSFSPSRNWQCPPLAFTPQTAYTVSSPGSTNHMWYSPLTPFHNLPIKTKDEMTTLFTPPTPPKTGPTHDDNSFRPKKLIRNMTLELLAIAKQNAVAAEGNYSLLPSFEFAHENHPAKPVTSCKNIQRSVISASTEINVINRVACNPRVQSPHAKLRKLLENILPSNIHARLRANQHRCVASLATRPLDKCNNSVTIRSETVDGIIEKILTCKKKGDHSRLVEHITELVQTVTCGTHRRVALSDTKDERRRTRLQELVSGVEHISTEERSIFEEWLRTISDSKSGTNEATCNPTVSAPSTRTTTRAATLSRPTAAVLVSNIPYSPEFTPYHNKHTNLAVPDALRKKLAKPLLPSDLKQGYIYIFWDEHHFGKLKIGYTNNLERRLQEWDRKCRRKHFYLSNNESPVEIPHVRRIENLIHIELKDCRLKRKCEGCYKTHEEWFDVGEKHAVKVLKKWQEWILQEPYAFDQVSNEWRLRSEMEHTVSSVCEPVPHKEKQQEWRRGSDVLRRPRM